MDNYVSSALKRLVLYKERMIDYNTQEGKNRRNRKLQNKNWNKK